MPWAVTRREIAVIAGGSILLLGLGLYLSRTFPEGQAEAIVWTASVFLVLEVAMPRAIVGKRRFLWVGFVVIALFATSVMIMTR